MFIAALVLSALGFILLVVTVTAPSEIWTWLLIITVVAGLVCFLIGESRARTHSGRRSRPPLDERTPDWHQDAL